MTSKRKFDTADSTRVKSMRFGVWDYYEEIPSYPGIWEYVPSLAKIRLQAEGLKNFKYFKILSRQLFRHHPMLCFAFVLYEMIRSILPAAALFLTGEMLSLVHRAIEENGISTNLVVMVAAGRFLVTFAERVENMLQRRITGPLECRMRSFFVDHVTRAHLRLDLPTAGDAAVKLQLDGAEFATVRDAQALLTGFIQLFGTVVSGFSAASVLLALLMKHQKSLPVLLACFIGPMLDLSLTYLVSVRKEVNQWHLAWAATCHDSRYIRMTGLRDTAQNIKHKSEIVAGNLGPYLAEQYQECRDAVGYEAGDFYQSRERMREKKMSVFSFEALGSAIISQVPHIVFVYQAISSPADLPMTMGSYTLTSAAISSLGSILWEYAYTEGGFTDRLEKLHRLFTVTDIKNQIADGTEPFPEDARKTATQGIGIEFRNVSFTYPGAKSAALKNISFKIEPGRLCVVVGLNGSGKSTILKLLCRLFDPSEGSILIDGRDIKVLRLAELRTTIATLFQDYTIFPLSIRDNIALGDPNRASDWTHVENVAKLSGVLDFQDRLPQGLDSYLTHPVTDHYSNLPEGTTQLFGKDLDFSGVREWMGHSRNLDLSGGQRQKIAVARTLMRGLGEESKVGLLLFDEPSASLDPVAEHTLFNTLRTCRGNKTMVFSSHRFGNLTRHSDLILYMVNAEILESGTHEQLMEQGGGYAEMWRMQAQAFLS